ncbi:MAG: hypothetical protein IT519_16675 [Burkholderiales bacterium]|nr:hypothetical protein [Burkholderiales bacterium]
MSDFATDFASRFAAAADRAGMRVEVQVRPKDCVARPYALRAALMRPDMLTDARAISTDWELEYVTTDAPSLAEGDAVEIAGVVYSVRERPRVPESTGRDGTFMRALLSRIATCDAP